MVAEAQGVPPEAQGQEEFDEPSRAAQIVNLSIHGAFEHFRASGEEISADIPKLSPQVQKGVFAASCLIPLKLPLNRL
jgi:hypothetical protein